MRRRVHSSSWLIFIMVYLVATAFSQSVPPVSFRVAPTYAVGSAPFEPVSVAVGGFNGDGKRDLAVAISDFISGIGSISVLLGNGDGTFQAAVNYASGSGTNSMAMGDFNGDGKLDLAVTNSSSVSVLLGNG